MEDNMTTLAPTTPANDADTYGWDTAFAINFANANTAIASGWPNVPDKAKKLAQAASDDPSYHIEGVFGPWQLTEGGDGKNVRMLCPVISGNYTAGLHVYPLVNMQVVMEVGMEWVPDPDQFAFVIEGSPEVDSIKTSLDQNKISADLQTEFTKQGKPLSGSATALVQQQGLEWLLTDGKANFYVFHTQDKDNNEFLTIYQFEAAWASNLKLLAKAVSEDEPAVTIITIVNNPSTGVAAAVLPELLSIWFNENIGDFNLVFAMLDLSPVVSQSDKYAWMKPTSTSYAVTDQGSLDTSVFGVLTMVNNNPAGTNHQVSPYAIPGGSDANAGFLISGALFMKNMLLAGARSIFNDAPLSSFEIINDGLTVQNTEDLVWGKFMMDNQSQGSIQDSDYSGQLDGSTISSDLVSDLQQNLGILITTNWQVQVTDQGSQWLLTNNDGKDEYILDKNGDNLDVYIATVVSIAKGQFKMSLIHTYVQIEFIDLKYSYSSDFDVHINYTEQVTLSLQPKGPNNKLVFWFDQILKNMVVSVTKTQSAITREIVEGAVMAVLSLVAVAGPIIEGLAAGAEVGEVTEDAGEAVIDAEAFADAEAADPEAAEADEAAAGEAAGEQAGGKLTAIKAAFATPKWKAVGALAALAGAVTGVDQTVSAICEAAAKNEWDKVPGFDDFANLAITPYTFPGASGFDLKSSGLAGSLQIGLKTK
jgi:hypothetical protein